MFVIVNLIFLVFVCSFYFDLVGFSVYDIDVNFVNVVLVFVCLVFVFILVFFLEFFIVCRKLIIFLNLLSIRLENGK